MFGSAGVGLPGLRFHALLRLEGLTRICAGGAAGRHVGGRLFRLDAEGYEATRTRVLLGRVSANTIEVVDGLVPGDRVVLSDMSAWDEFDRLRID